MGNLLFGPTIYRICLFGMAYKWLLRAWTMADKFSLPAVYDAHYLALAELLEGEFWTADGRLARTVQSSLPWVHLVE